MTATTLSNSERIGVAAARRVHAVGGADLVRMMGTALIAFLLIDFVRLAVASPVALADAALVTSMDALAWVAMGTAIWRPRTGLVLAAVPLVTTLAWTSTSMDGLLLTVVTGLALAQVSRRTAAWISAALVVFVVLRTVLHSGDAHGLVALTLGVHLAVGLAIGWAGLARRTERERRERTELHLATENSRIRADERRVLARELHDVIAHQLSTASLQIMGTQGSSDAATLARTLATVDRATSEALLELRLLVKVLREDPATAASGTEIRELAERVPPTQTAAAAELALLAAGFEPDIEVPAITDDLAMTIQRTLSRVLREATGNVIQHAPAQSWCTARTSVCDQQVSIEIRNPVAADLRLPALGWGLRGLRERIALTGGSFTVEIVDSTWVVTATLPRT